MIIGDRENNVRSAAEPSSCPPRWGLLILWVLMLAAYLGPEILTAVGVIIWRVANNQPIDPEVLANSELLIWANLLAGALGATAAICLALFWPRVWRLMTSSDGGGIAGWLSWVPLLHFSLWVVPALTLPFMLFVVLGITQLFGEAQVDAQLKLFTTPGLRIVTSIVVSTVIPLAEEFIFRGAMYNLLLPARRRRLPEWARQALPLVITSLLFASAHLLAGFETPAAIAQVLILSFYLGSLRAVSGSVKSSVAAHITWNLISALVLATGFTP